MRGVMEGRSTPSRHCAAVVRAVAAATVLALPVVTTGCGADALTASTIESLDATTAQAQALRIGVGEGGEPLYIVDGVIVNEAVAHGLGPGSIATIEVVKGQAAAALYGDRAVHGVIMIVTTGGGAVAAATAADRNAARTGGDAVAGVLIRRAGEGSASAGEEPLVIVDGVVAARGALGRIRPDDIESIEVVKGTAAAALYGEQAAHGVVRVTTRRRN